VVLKLPPSGLCAGFFIDQHRILSNAHCLRVESPYQVYEVVTYRQYLDDASLDESSYFILAQVDTVRDLALFQEVFAGSIPHAVTVPPIYRGAYPRIGSETIVVGHPAGQLFNVSTGIISRIGFEDSRTRVQYLFSTAPIWYGNSGGPIFNNYGEVIGVTVSIRREQPYLGQFISYSEIAEFLEEVREIEDE
jgi:S1-C subfamily serine protease